MKRLLLVLLLAVTTYAWQGPPSPPGGITIGGPWWDSPLAKDINLSDDQQQKVQNVVKEFRDQLSQQRGDLFAAEGALRELLQKDPVDVAKAREAIERSVQARSRLGRSVAEMSLRMRLILTSQQWQDLQNRSRSSFGFGGSRRHNRPDGSHGPPPEHQ